ncbi:MAG: hypothetical protein M0036_07985 [Desulfobacteraceae bacterium]|nr:hypothetical protein [Desulfobacteraceae bacterium]
MIADRVRRRRLPIVGDGAGIWSFIHISNEAPATAAAIAHGEPGIYKVVDDEPAPVSIWLKVKRELKGPIYPIWRHGFVEGLGDQ